MKRNVITRKTALISKHELEQVTSNENLTAEAKVIYLHLLAKTNVMGVCSPSLIELSRELCMSERRVIAHRRLLEEQGLLKVIKSGSKGTFNNSYHVLHNFTYGEIGSATKECGVSANEQLSVSCELKSLSNQLRSLADTLSGENNKDGGCQCGEK